MRGQLVRVAASAPAAVDLRSRRVAGTVVPWGKAALVDGVPFPLAFARGSLAIDERARLLRNHNRHDVVGVPEWWADAPDRMRAGFRVGRHPAGEEALTLAEDGIVTGLSLGAELLDVVEAGGDLIARAALVLEVSLVGMPAYVDSRLGA